MSDPQVATTDVVLVGAGIMSATLGALLRQVEPDWSITLIERLDGAAAESSDESPRVPNPQAVWRSSARREMDGIW